MLNVLRQALAYLRTHWCLSREERSKLPEIMRQLVSLAGPVDLKSIFRYLTNITYMRFILSDLIVPFGIIWRGLRMKHWRQANALFHSSCRTDDGRVMLEAGSFASILLRSAHDPESISMISKYADRICLYQKGDNDDEFTQVEGSHAVSALMNAGVCAVCISYKHTRRSAAGLPKDRARIYRVVKLVASHLSMHRLLFWSDITGRAPTNWVEQGVEPYLVMPTVRVVSEELKEEIKASFWMNVELWAACVRGGLCTIDESTGEFGIPDGIGTVDVCMSRYDAYLEYARLDLATELCRPRLYFSKARCESDKLALLRYALQYLSPRMGLILNKDGLFEPRSTSDLSIFMFGQTSTAGVSAAEILPRPTDVFSAQEDDFRIGEKLFPASLLLEPVSRSLCNIASTIMAETVLIGPITPSSTEVVIRLLMSDPGGALKITVADYREEGNELHGRVVCFQVANEEEENHFQNGNAGKRKLCFEDCGLPLDENGNVTSFASRTHLLPASSFLRS